MSSNMQRQAAPLSHFEKCIIGIELKRQAALDFGVLVIAIQKKYLFLTTTINFFFYSKRILLYLRKHKFILIWSNTSYY